MIPYQDHILPTTETPFNKALSSVSTRLEGINAPIREVWDPWTVPERFLKFLAHALSVDLWVDEWPDIRKRSIIADAIRMHRIKGTLDAVHTYLSYVDAGASEVLTPPMRVFSGPSLTREAREAWLASLPQVRTWRIRERGFKGFALHSGGFGFKSFFNGAFPIPSTAIQRHRRRARWVVGGEETEVSVSDFGNHYRLHLLGNAGSKVFCDRVIARSFFQPSSARDRLVTIRPTPRLPWRSSVGPSLEAVTSEPERIVESGQMDRGVFCGRPVREGFFRPSTASLRIYSRYAVHDGSFAHRRPSIQFMGVGRYGFPAHTAHVRVDVTGRRSAWAAGEGIAKPRLRFWCPRNPRPMRDVRRALVASKRASDDMYVRYPKRHRFIAGKPFYAGDDQFVVGKP